MDGTAELAIGFAPFETRAELIVRVAQLADRTGYGGFGVAEAMGNAAPPPQPAEDARPLRLAVTAEPAVPLALAALAPPAVRVAGELADRWLPFLWPRTHLDAGRRLLQEGAATAGRSELPKICPAVPLAVGPDDASAEQVAARWLTVYCTRMGSIYPRMLRDRFGYAAEVDALLAANVDREIPVLPAATRRLAEDVLVLATYEDATAAAAQWVEAGADQVSLSLPLGASEQELSAAVLAAAPEPGSGAAGT